MKRVDAADRATDLSLLRTAYSNDRRAINEALRKLQKEGE